MTYGVSATIRRTSAGIVVLAYPGQRMIHRHSLNDEFVNEQRKNKPMEAIFEKLKKRKFVTMHNKRALRIEEIDTSQNGKSYVSVCVCVCVFLCVCVCVTK